MRLNATYLLDELHISEFNDDDDASSSDMSEYDWDDSDDEMRSSSNKQQTSRHKHKKHAPKRDPKIQNVMEMMDRELAQTEVGKSFERGTSKQVSLYLRIFRSKNICTSHDSYQ